MIIDYRISIVTSRDIMISFSAWLFQSIANTREWAGYRPDKPTGPKSKIIPRGRRRVVTEDETSCKYKPAIFGRYFKGLAPFTNYFQYRKYRLQRRVIILYVNLHLFFVSVRTTIFRVYQ